MLLILFTTLAGVDNGQTIRIPVDHTEAFAILRVRESDVFERDGYDVHSDVDISFPQAVLGGTVRIQGLHGALDVKVLHVFLKFAANPRLFRK